MHGQAKKRTDAAHGWRQKRATSASVNSVTTKLPAVTTPAAVTTPTSVAAKASSVASSNLVSSPLVVATPVVVEDSISLVSVTVSEAVPTHEVTVSTVASNTQAPADASPSAASVKGGTPASASTDDAINSPASAAPPSPRTTSVTLSGSTTTTTTSYPNSTPTIAPSGGLGGAGTAGIVLASLLAGTALLIFVIRKTFIARRKRKRNSWEAGLFPEMGNIRSERMSLDPPPLPEKNSTPRTPVWALPRPSLENLGSPYYVTPPPITYSPAMDVAGAFPLSPITSTFPGSPMTPNRVMSPNSVMSSNLVMRSNSVMNPSPGMSPSPAMSPLPVSAAAIETAIVRQVYVPTLPDELSVSAGEVVQLVNAFDDGWGLCQNSRGEQGVVPLECLEFSGSAQGQRLTVAYGQQDGTGEWRNLKRLSSLQPQPEY